MRAHAILNDVPLHDVWRLDLPGGGDGRTVADIVEADENVLRESMFGKAFLKRLAQIAVEKNCGRMEGVVLDWNESAIDFYKKLGAETLDAWTTYRLNEKEIETLASS